MLFNFACSSTWRDTRHYHTVLELSFVVRPEHELSNVHSRPRKPSNSHCEIGAGVALRAYLPRIAGIYVY